MLSSVKQLRYVHNLFEADAKRFYQSHVLDKSLYYAKAKQMVEDEYCTIARQNLARQYLLGLYLTQVIDQESCSSHEGLEKLLRKITSLASQGRKSQGPEEAKFEYLYSSRTGIEFDKTALTNCYA